MYKKEYTVPIKQTLTSFINNAPYRSSNKVVSLVNKEYNVPIDVETVQDTIPKLDNYDLKKAKNKYQQKFVAPPYSYIGDIFFPLGKKVAFLLLIEINTRKAFAYQLGDVSTTEIINVDEDTYERYVIAPQSKLKTTKALMDVFSSFVHKNKIKSLRFDGESGINNESFQNYLKKLNIQFIPILKKSHTSSSLIDRLCRTLRDIAFNMHVEISDQHIMNTILKYYNNAPHKTLTEACFDECPNLKLIYPYGISPNDMSNNDYLQKLYIIQCLKFNYIVDSDTEELHIRDKCRVYKEKDKLSKTRSKLSKDIFQVIDKKGKIYILQNINDNKEIINLPRHSIVLINSK